VGSTRVRLAIGLGLLLVVGALVVVLSKSEQRLAGTNAQVRVSGNDVVFPGRKASCQPEGLPQDTTAVRVFAGVPKGSAGPMDLVIKKNGRTIATGRFDELQDGLPATTRLSPFVSREVTSVEVCFRNRGRSTIRLAGDRTPVRFSGSNPFGFLFADEPRVDYLRAGEESWWSLAGVVADRFGRGKTSFFGSWTMWAVFALVGATWAAALVLLLRKRPTSA
jgi:hypothetical protein